MLNGRDHGEWLAYFIRRGDLDPEVAEQSARDHAHHVKTHYTELE